MSVTGHTSFGGHADPPQEQQKAVGISDVAQAAEASYQTVSRVIHGRPNMRKETLERVEAAGQPLGFRRNATAFAPAGGVTRSVTVLTSNTALYSYAATLQGSEEASRTTGYPFGVPVVTPEDDLDRQIASAADTSGGLTAVSYDRLGTTMLGRVPAHMSLGGLVEAPWPVRAPDRPTVWADDREAALTATQHLLALGHESVHYVAIPASAGTRRRAAPRTDGGPQALRAVGLAHPAPCGNGWDPQAVSEAGKKLAKNPNVTAILCGNDDLALGVLRALRLAGRRVPEGVTVIGFDDARRSGFISPPLTAVRMDSQGLGRIAFGPRRAQLGTDGQSPESVPTDPTLIPRESSGPRTR